MSGIQLGSTVIDANSPPYIIAEIGVNHGGSLKKVKPSGVLAWQAT